METIKLLPHHIYCLIKTFLEEPGEQFTHSDYNLNQYRQEVSLMKKILENPNQAVQIVSELDSICAACPYNSESDNYNSVLPQDYCSLASGIKLYKTNFTNDHFWAGIFGLTNLVDKEPITSSRLLELMKEGVPQMKECEARLKECEAIVQKLESRIQSSKDKVQ